MHVIGTAGHVDHGKSTLIKSLTGIDPDRLREEKERQMTIDLGFAWLELPSGEEIGIVDVPGHRDFIENMLSGAGGIDAVLFIIAADEGIMPQSKEHLAILKLLEIKYGIIVLTKIDLVDDIDWLDLVKSDIRKFTGNSFLSDAPIIEVSSINGTGLPDLKIAIDNMIGHCEAKKDVGKARLPIDRVFSIKGFGTVVTGTMLDGTFSVGQQIEVLPGKQESRIRGIQSHKKKLQTAQPGSRTAINLTGMDVNEIKRGDVLAQPGKYIPAQRIDVHFKMIGDASGQIKHNDSVKIFTGTSQSIARVRVIQKQQIQPGESGWLQLDLNEKLVVGLGDHYILRRPSPAETIGGGIILDPAPQKRHKRFSQSVLDHFQMMESGSLEEKLLALISEAQPISVSELLNKSGLLRKELIAELSKLSGSDLILLDSTTEEIGENSFIYIKKDWEELSRSILKIIDNFHRQYPMRVGIDKNDLKNMLSLKTDDLNKMMNSMLIRNQIKQLTGLISLPDHEVEFSLDIKREISKIMDRFQSSPFSPPSLSEITEIHDPDLISAMISQGMIIATSEDIAFRKEDFKLMGKKLKEFIDEKGGISLSQFRDLFQTSRKFALSYLEFLDRSGVTKFDGDKRTIKNIDKLSL